MPSTIKEKVTGSNQTAKIAKSSGKIACFFPKLSGVLSRSQDGGSVRPVAGILDPSIHPASTAASVNLDSYSDSMMAFRSVPGPSSQLLTLCVDLDLQTLLHALPTRAHIEALIGCLEEQNRKDFLMIKWDFQTLLSQLTTGETSLETLQQ